MKLCDDTLQRAPTFAPVWISTKVPILLSSPMAQPYRFTRSGCRIRTLPPSTTSCAIGIFDLRAMRPARAPYARATAPVPYAQGPLLHDEDAATAGARSSLVPATNTAQQQRTLVTIQQEAKGLLPRSASRRWILPKLRGPLR